MSAAIPEQWSEIEFEDFATLQRGKDLTRSQFREGTIPVAGSNGVIGYHDTAIAKAPGITVGRSGSVGKVTVYNEDFWPHNTSLYVRDFHDNDPHFAGYLLESLNLTRFKTGASVPTLDRNSFKTLPVLVPPLLEQKKIAHILSTVQRAIEAQERLIQTTTELKKALMHRLFTEGLRNEPQKQTEIGPIPESWKMVEVGNVFKFASGKTKPKDTTPNPTDKNTIPVYGGNGVLGFTSEILLQDTTLILGRVGEYCGCAHLTAPLSWVTDNALYAKEEKIAVNHIYIKTHFEHLNLNRYSNKMGQPLITQGIIHRVKFGLPSCNEQEELGSIFTMLDRRLAQLELKKTSLQDIFRTLLHELMTAKIRVHTIEKLID